MQPSHAQATPARAPSVPTGPQAELVRRYARILRSASALTTTRVGVEGPAVATQRFQREAAGRPDDA
jgi:hypothetical protein